MLLGTVDRSWAKDGISLEYEVVLKSLGRNMCSVETIPTLVLAMLAFSSSRKGRHYRRNLIASDDGLVCRPFLMYQYCMRWKELEAIGRYLCVV